MIIIIIMIIIRIIYLNFALNFFNLTIKTPKFSQLRLFWYFFQLQLFTMSTSSQYIELQDALSYIHFKTQQLVGSISNLTEEVFLTKISPSLFPRTTLVLLRTVLSTKTVFMVASCNYQIQSITVFNEYVRIDYYHIELFHFRRNF